HGGLCVLYFFFSSRRRHTRLQGDWSSDVCSSDLVRVAHGTGETRLGVLDPDSGRLTDLNLPFQVFVSGVSAAGQTIATIAGGPEIGRASCRERVWGSGVAAVVCERRKCCAGDVCD